VQVLELVGPTQMKCLQLYIFLRMNPSVGVIRRQFPAHWQVFPTIWLYFLTTTVDLELLASRSTLKWLKLMNLTSLG
jgi:hypothetical protein